MNRRRFLQFSSAATGALALGSGVQSAPQDPLPDARKRAQAVGKPLLLIPIVEDEKERARRVGQWQEFFCTSLDEHLAVLALCEVVFAPLPEGQALDDERDLGLLSDLDGESWHLIPYKASAEKPPIPFWRRHSIAEMAEQVRGVLVPDKEALQALVEQVRKSRPPRKSSLDGLLHPDAYTRGRPPSNLLRPEPSAPRVRLADVDRRAAQVWEFRQSTEDPERRDRATRVLAAAAALRLYGQDPAGARWEDPPNEDPCPGCGMGYTPFKSRLFLDAYTR